MLRHLHHLEHVVRVVERPGRPFGPSHFVARCRCGRTFTDDTRTGARSLHSTHVDLVLELRALS